MDTVPVALRRQETPPLGCVLFVVDLSNSMARPRTGSKRTLLGEALRGINQALERVAHLWGNPEEAVSVGVLGYTTEEKGLPSVRGLLPGSLRAKALCSSTALSEQAVVNSEGRTIWCRSPARSALRGTPMNQALDQAARYLEKWCQRCSRSYPPFVVHITDGESTDGDPVNTAQRLKTLGTTLGKTLVLHNLLIPENASPLLWIDQEGIAAEDYGRSLYWASSPIPGALRRASGQQGLAIPATARGLCLNAEIADMMDLVFLAWQSTNLPPGDPDPEDALPRNRLEMRLRRCPRCDRPGFGTPGQRHCMVCDMQF